MPGIFQRMIFLELLRIFLLCWLGLTGIILMAGVFAEATQHGLGPGQVLAILPCLVPNTIPYTLPTTTLFAVCIVYGRLASDNEILAIKAAGINVIHVVSPAILLGVLASAITLGVYWNHIPEAHWELRTKFVKDIKELLYGMLRREQTIRHPQIKYHISVHRVEGVKLIHTIINHWNPTMKRYDFSICAQEAEIDVDMIKNQIILRLKNTNYATAEEPFGKDEENGKFEVDLPADFGNPYKSRATDMTWQEVLDRREEVEAERAEVRRLLAMWEKTVLDGGTNAQALDQIDHLQKRLTLFPRELGGLNTELHMRPALAMGCLCFVLVGCPVGIWFGKSDYLSAFITCFLPIVLVYYPLMLFGLNLGKHAKFDPLWTVWPANVLLALTSVFLFRNLARN